MATFASFNMMRKVQFIVGEAMPTNISVNSLMGLIIGSISAMVGIGGGALSIPLMNAFSVAQQKYCLLLLKDWAF